MLNITDKRIKDDEVLIEIGKRIQEFRLSKKIKQKEFALIADISRQSLSKIECGATGVSEITLRNLILHFPDFDPIYILTGKKKEVETAPTEGVEKEV